MSKKEVAKKLIVVESVGTINELGGISGPILSPCYVPLDTINNLLNHHRIVYEINPKNRSERVQLSLKNLRKKNFSEETVPVKAHLAPNIYTSATVRNSNDVKAKELSNDTTMVTPPVKKVTSNKTNTETVVEEKKETPTSDFVKNN